MHELVDVWRKPKMVAAIFLTALIYAALIIPFKGIILVPGISEVRPSAFMPALAGFIFGPAGAWGAAIGNLVGDLFGTLTFASIFGFIGNLGMGYLPYKLWYHLFRKNPIINEIDFQEGRQALYITLCGLLGNLYGAMAISYGVYWLVNRSFFEIWVVLFAHNSVTFIVLYPLLRYVYPKAYRYGLTWYQQNDEAPASTPTQQLISLLIVSILLVGTAFAAGSAYTVDQISVTDHWFTPMSQLVFWSALLTTLMTSIIALYDN